jgi:periplasmic divalent cation tolerance protein
VSPYPPDPVRAVGPMRIVMTAFPHREAALSAARGALERRLAACANLLPADSRFVWRGRIESATEVVVLFKTVPKRVGALFAFLETVHPYDVPELVELDVPRVGSAYLTYLARVLDASALSPPLASRARRPGARRGPGARVPRRTRAPRRRRSR